MSGVKGRSGRRPKSAAAHVLNGTFRPDRHGPRPPTNGGTLQSMTVGATALRMNVPPIPKPLIVGLRERGLQFVLDLWSQYDDWSPADRIILHEAAVVADALADCEAIIGSEGRLVPGKRGKRSLHPLLRVQAQAQRTLMLLLGKLDLKEQ